MNRRHPRQIRRLSALSRRLLLQNLEQRHLFAADGLSVEPDSAATWANSSPVLINVLANDTFDSDYVGNRRITSVSTGSLGGRIEIANGGSEIRYTPPANVSGIESFRYTVDDLKSAAVAVDIRSPLQPFEITIDHFQDEYRFDLLANAVFPDGYTGAKRISLTSDTALGAELRITPDGKSVIYVNDGHQYGDDSFTYIVDDLYVGSAKVTSINPLASDSYEVIQNSGSTSLAVLDNDFRPRPINGLSGVVSEATWETVRANARITHVLDDAKGEVDISADGRSLVFIPAANESGYRHFRYVVDGRFETNFSVIIQRPVVDDYVNADVDGGAHTLNVLQNDQYYSIYQNSPVRIVERVTSVTQGDKGGAVSINADGVSVSYTPASGFTGTETFEYVADGKHTAKVSVQVTQPVRDDSFVVYHNFNNTLLVLKNDFSAENPVARTITSVSESTLGGDIRIQSNGSLLYTPPSDWSHDDYKQDTFTYTVNNQYTASVSVWLGRLTVSDQVRFDKPLSRIVDVLGNDLFGLNYLGNRVITAVTQPNGGGSVVIDADTKTLRYTPGALDASFTYTVDNLFTETVYVSAIPWLYVDSAVADQNGSAITVDVLLNDFTTFDTTHSPIRSMVS
jgi:Bacterial Ig domain